MAVFIKSEKFKKCLLFSKIDLRIRLPYLKIPKTVEAQAAA